MTGGAGFIGANLCGPGSRPTASTRWSCSTTCRPAGAENLDGLDVELVEGSHPRPRAARRGVRAAPTRSSTSRRGPRCPARSQDPLATPRRQRHRHAPGARGGARRRTALHVVVASSSSVYGANPDAPEARGPRDRIPLTPVRRLASSPPRRTRSPTERASSCPCSRSASSTCSARCRRPATPTPRWSRPSSTPRSRGEPLAVHGDGEQTRDFTYVGTVCDDHRRRR